MEDKSSVSYFENVALWILEIDWGPPYYFCTNPPCLSPYTPAQGCNIRRYPLDPTFSTCSISWRTVDSAKCGQTLFEFTTGHVHILWRLKDWWLGSLEGSLCLSFSFHQLMWELTLKSSERGWWMVTMTIRFLLASSVSSTTIWLAVMLSRPVVGSSSKITPAMTSSLSRRLVAHWNTIDWEQ